MKNKTQPLPHVRNIRDTVKEIKTIDPASAVSEYMIRRAIKEGRLPCIMSGRNIYVNVAVVREYMHGTI